MVQIIDGINCYWNWKDIAISYMNNTEEQMVGKLIGVKMLACQ